MRISDWSSDVCSSDLNVAARASGDQVVAGPRVDRIIAFLAQDDVVSGAGVDRVIAARPAAFLRQFRIVGADIGDRVLTIPYAAISGGIDRFGRSAARRLGKGWVSTCRSRWSR